MRGLTGLTGLTALCSYEAATGIGITVVEVPVNMAPFTSGHFDWARRHEAGACSVVVRCGNRLNVLNLIPSGDGRYEGRWNWPRAEVPTC